MAFYTYIVASGRNGTLYTGSTDDLLNRIAQHRAKSLGGFTAKYGVDQLVWFQVHATREEAFRKERRIKKWNRLWKLQMIDAFNPDWRDLFDEFRLGGLKDAADWVPAFAGMSGEEND
ncbi:MAG: GIY-YIG nuclease family protein [Pseudomonadota bacterium]